MLYSREFFSYSIVAAVVVVAGGDVGTERTALLKIFNFVRKKCYIINESAEQLQKNNNRTQIT